MAKRASCPMKRPLPEEIPAPPYVPEDAVRLDDYPDMVELLRSKSLSLDATYAATAPFTAGALFQLDGKEHTSRRRALNKLVHPAALDWHREGVLLPLMHTTLAELRDHPDPDGVHRLDLMTLTRRLFTSFAGAIIGADNALTPAGAEQLFSIFEKIENGYRAKYVADPDARQAALDQAVDARNEFESTFYDPAYAAWQDRLERVAAGSLDEDELPHNLIGLIAQGAHPDYEDKTCAVNECLMVLLGAVDTSSNLIVQELDLLWDWLEAHPEDRERLGDRTFLLKVSQETLRLHSAFETMTRWAVEDLTFPSGKAVATGEPAYGVFIAANSDPAVWGPGFLSFNPERDLPSGVPHYGTSFGGGIRQCLGLRIVLGEKDTGERASHLDVLLLLLQAGVERDPDRDAALRPNDTGHPASYPVVFTNLGAVAATA